MKYLLTSLFLFFMYANANEIEDKRVIQDNISSILIKLKDERNKNFILQDKVEMLEKKTKKLENQIDILKKFEKEINKITYSQKEKSNNSLINQRLDRNEFPKLQMKENYSKKSE